MRRFRDAIGRARTGQDAAPGRIVHERRRRALGRAGRCRRRRRGRPRTPAPAARGTVATETPGVVHDASRGSTPTLRPATTLAPHPQGRIAHDASTTPGCSHRSRAPTAGGVPRGRLRHPGAVVPRVGRRSVLGARGAVVQLADDLGRVAPLVHDGDDGRDDGRLDAVPPGELEDGPAGLGTLGRRPGRLDGLRQGEPLADVGAEPVVARAGRGAGGDEVADAREAEERLPLGADRETDPGALRQAARHDRRDHVVAVPHPLGDADGERDDVLHRAADLEPDDVGAREDAEVRRRDRLGDPVRDVLTPYAGLVAPEAVVVSLMKGVELSTLEVMSQVLMEIWDLAPERMAVVSGPNLAGEIARREPT
ncbi:MAG: hypothetical protein J0H73_04340, partial [Salana multivorans]|nr:hypothetical protein [Salana multivorans]